MKKKRDQFDYPMEMTSSSRANQASGMKLSGYLIERESEMSFSPYNFILFFCVLLYMKLKSCLDTKINK